MIFIRRCHLQSFSPSLPSLIILICPCNSQSFLSVCVIYNHSLLSVQSKTATIILTSPCQRKDCTHSHLLMPDKNTIVSLICSSMKHIFSSAHAELKDLSLSLFLYFFLSAHTKQKFTISSAHNLTNKGN